MLKCHQMPSDPAPKFHLSDARHGFGLHVAALINPTRSAAAPPHEQVGQGVATHAEEVVNWILVIGASKLTFGTSI